MKRVVGYFVFFMVLFGIVGCGGGENIGNDKIHTARLIKVSGIGYETSSGIEGVTGKDGAFNYKNGDDLKFFMGNLVLGVVHNVNGDIAFSDFKNSDNIAALLMTFDDDQYYDNGINIDQKVFNYFKNIQIRSIQNREISIDIDSFNVESARSQEFVDKVSQSLNYDYEIPDNDDVQSYKSIQLVEKTLSGKDKEFQKIWQVLSQEDYYRRPGATYNYEGRTSLKSPTARLSLYLYERDVSKLLTDQINNIDEMIDMVEKTKLIKDTTATYYGYISSVGSLYKAVKTQDIVEGMAFADKLNFNMLIYVSDLEKEYPAAIGGLKAAFSCAVDGLVKQSLNSCIEEGIKSIIDLSLGMELMTIRKRHNDMYLTKLYLEEYYKSGKNIRYIAKKYNLNLPDEYFLDVRAEYEILKALIKKHDLGIVTNGSDLNAINIDMASRAWRLAQVYINMIDEQVTYIAQSLGFEDLDAYFLSDVTDYSDVYKIMNFEVYGGMIDSQNDKNIKFYFNIENRGNDIVFQDVRAFTLDTLGKRVYIPLKYIDTSFHLADGSFLEQDIEDSLKYLIVRKKSPISGMFSLYLTEEAQKLLNTSTDESHKLKASPIFFEVTYALENNLEKFFTQKTVFYFDADQGLEALNRKWYNPGLVIEMDKTDIIVSENENEICFDAIVKLGNYNQSNEVNLLNLTIEQITGDQRINFRDKEIKNYYEYFTEVGKKFCFMVPEIEAKEKEFEVYKFKIFSYTDEKIGDTKEIRVKVLNDEPNINQRPTFIMKVSGVRDVMKLIISAEDDKSLSKIVMKIEDLDTHRYIDIQEELIPQRYKTYEKVLTIDRRNNKYIDGKTYRAIVWVYDSQGRRSFPRTKIFNVDRKKDNSPETIPPQVIIEKNTISGVVTDSYGSPLSGITVKFEYIQDGESTSVEDITDENGRYKIELTKEDFDNFKNDTKLVIYAYADGYAPSVEEITKTDVENIYKDFILELIKENEIVLEIEPQLHHLGDGHYGGTINSDFQRVDAEGIEFEKTFYIVDNQYNNYQRAEISFEAKGVQTDSYYDKLYINNKIYRLLKSPDDGSYATQSFSIDKSVYQFGMNTLKIISSNDYDGDYDDFEFINIKITFLDPVENDNSSEQEEVLHIMEVDPMDLYRDEYNEVVFDVGNNLMWQDNYSVAVKTFTFENALDYCKNLVFAGYDDWRMPKLSELGGIRAPDKEYPASFDIFQNTAYEPYWADYFAYPYRWYIHMGTGVGLATFSADDKFYVRCVREDR